MEKILMVAALGMLTALLPSAASAHHATAAQYDVSATLTLKGVITRLEWSNPHIHVYFDVKNEDGGSDNWVIEFPAPGATIVAGLSRRLLAPGTTLSFDAYPAKPSADRSKNQHSACAKSIMLPDGSRLTFVVGI
ncbi:MAG TPA: DUF6152 family protein [Terriglobia bacterium]